MKKYLSLVVCWLAIFCAGCTLPDMLFSVLGDHYSGDGPTCDEKRYHFDRQIEKHEAYEKNGSTPSY